MTREKLKQILIDFFKSNPHLVQNLIDKGSFNDKHMTVDKFISEIELGENRTFGWVLNELLYWKSRGVSEYCPVKYLHKQNDDAESMDAGLWLYGYNGEIFNVEGLGNDEVNDVYTVEYKEIPVIVKKWVRV